MKKIMISIWIITIGSLGYISFFYNPSHTNELSTTPFSTIKSIKIHHTDNPSRESILITKQEQIPKITDILNYSKSLPKNIDFKLAGESNIEMTLTYENNKEEKLSIWDDFEKGQTLISSDTTGYYILDDNQYKNLVHLIH